MISAPCGPRAVLGRGQRWVTAAAMRPAAFGPLRGRAAAAQTLRALSSSSSRASVAPRPLQRPRRLACRAEAGSYSLPKAERLEMTVAGSKVGGGGEHKFARRRPPRRHTCSGTRPRRAATPFA